MRPTTIIRRLSAVSGCPSWPQPATAVKPAARAGSQAIVATHSPIVAAAPGASIVELGEWGMRPARWEELHLVGARRRFLAEPASYFRHLLAG